MNKNFLKANLAVIIATGVIALPLQAANLFVGGVPSGESGSSFLNIQAAVDVVQPGDTIYLRGGNYHEEVNATNLQGTQSAPIKITNWNGESVRMDGSSHLNDLGSNGWTLMGSGEGHPNCADNCYKTSINQDIWQLWVDDRMQVVARWPNVTVGHPTDPIHLKVDKITPADGSWFDKAGTWGHMANSWNYDSGSNTSTVKNNTAFNDLSIGDDAQVSFSGGSVILNYHSESQFSRVITSHTPGSNSIVHDGVINPKDQGSGHFLVEAKNALDMPGEWYYDIDTGEVWLWPEDGQNPTGKNVRGKTQSYAIDFSGSSYLTIEGLEFFGTTITSITKNDSHHVTINDNKFLYPSWYKRMLREHTIFSKTVDGEMQHTGGSDVGATIITGDSLLISNNEFAYGDATIDLSEGRQKVDNVVTNNLFHHWGLVGMAGPILDMNSNKGNSEQSYNTFHTHGGQLMFKGSYVNVNWSRASYWGYFKQDGVAFQCGGNGSVSTVRHHIWVHNAFKGGVRWDGEDGGIATQQGGLDHHLAGANVPGLAKIKGDYHQVYHMSGVLPLNGSASLINVDNVSRNGEQRNNNTRVFNNIAHGISGDPNKFEALNGENGYNWNGLLHAVDGDIASAQMRDANNLDFRPIEGSDVIDAGIVIPGINDNYIGNAPDIGAYEYGDSNYWIPGYRAKNKANSPVPMDQTLTAKTDTDLIFLAARNAVSNNVYLGSTKDNLSLLAGNVASTNNIVVPGALNGNQVYYWRVDSVLADASVVTGDVWSFTAKEAGITMQQTFVVSADVDVSSDRPDNNSEGNTKLFFRTPSDGSEERRAYLKFDVAIDGDVISATLRLHRSGTKVFDVQVYAMSDSSWDPAEVTWNNRPIIDGALLATGDVKSDWGEFDVTRGVRNGTVSLALNRLPNTNSKFLDAMESGFAAHLVVVYGDASDDLAPAAPVNVAATDGFNSITVSWDASTESDVIGYKVYRREHDEDFFDSPIHPGLLTQTSFEDTIVVFGQSYQYVVRAVDARNQESGNSLFATSTVLDSDSDGLSDSWEATYGLDSNANDAALDLDGDGFSNLQEFLAGSNPVNPISTPENPSGEISLEVETTLITSGDTYIDSVDADANFDSAERLFVRVSGKNSLQTGLLKFNVELSGSIVSATLRLHGTGNDVEGVQIYGVKDNSWQSDTVTWNTQPVIDDTLLDDGNLAKDQWTDFDVTSAVASSGELSFAIKRVGNNRSRGFDSIESGFAPELVIVYLPEESDPTPSAPQNVVVEENFKSLSISWDEVDEQGVVGYNIYRISPTDVTFTIPLNSQLLTQTNFIDTSVLLAQVYQYAVLSVDAQGVESSDYSLVLGLLSDADNDGMADNWEVAYSLNPAIDDSQDDFDADLLSNIDEYYSGLLPNEADTDNDGAIDGIDQFPLNSGEWLDTDFDGIGNNADSDDDNDNVLDVADAFPLDATEWSDFDADSIGDNADNDDDNDGVNDDVDQHLALVSGNIVINGIDSGVIDSVNTVGVPLSIIFTTALSQSETSNNGGFTSSAVKIVNDLRNSGSITNKESILLKAFIKKLKPQQSNQQPQQSNQQPQ
ncbi:DUF7594 domain-containing protein, partial [Colwellia piezophila]|uniref:CBM96 family carbohydrate-binding protein n=1 Tax=Colwellia piezophila TaxID=211668 RepID=UPI00058FE9BD